MIKFDFSGDNGQDGIQEIDQIGNVEAKADGGKGANGANGGQGQNGQSGGNISLKMQINEQKVILTEEFSKKVYDNLELGNQYNKIVLISNGGKGGNGASGNNGKNGNHGYDGKDATKEHRGENGGDGGDGGNGGSGGNGGNGGDGGIIQVVVDEKDMDLLMLIDQYTANGGQPGFGGQRGIGGQGGLGGKGGSSYSHAHKNENGEVIHLQNQGGKAGSQGRQGKDGENGKKGQPGKNGTFCYLVNGKQFLERYDVKIESVEQVNSPDNIIEPGEIMLIRYMTLKNFGKMNTPIYQNIILNIKQNEWIVFKPEFQASINKSIGIGQVTAIDNPLRFQINDHIIPSADTIFKTKVVVEYQAKVDRINKEFSQVQGKTDSYSVRFPVEMTSAQFQRSITLNEESPFAISICNRSSEPIGFETLNKRLLNFRLILQDKNQRVEFVPKNTNDQTKYKYNNSEKGIQAKNQRNYINPTFQDDQNFLLDQEFIADLSPNQTYTISGTIKIKDFNIPPFTNIKMQAKLDLGYYHDQQNTFQNIQVRNLTLQLSESFKHHPNSDFLLIVNCNTPSSLIYSFKDFAHSIGSCVDIWNISNYQGFSFDYAHSSDEVLSQLYRNKIAIILSNEYEASSYQKTNAVKQIQESSIYKAAKDYGIHTYILGPNKNYDQFWLTHPVINPQTSVAINKGSLDKFYLQFQSEVNNRAQQKQELQSQYMKQTKGLYSYTNSYNYDLIESFSFCSTPNILQMKKTCENIKKKIDAINPKYSHQINFEYQGILLKKNTFSTEYQMGPITFIESLKRDSASIITRNFDGFNEESALDKIDQYCLFKLLPFETKFSFFEKNLINLEYSRLIFYAIISDLCDEYNTFKYVKQNTLQLQKSLTMWNFFQQYPFQNKLSINGLIQCQRLRGNVISSETPQPAVVIKNDKNSQPHNFKTNQLYSEIQTQIYQENLQTNFTTEADELMEDKQPHMHPHFDDSQDIPEQNINIISKNNNDNNNNQKNITDNNGSYKTQQVSQCESKFYLGNQKFDSNLQTNQILNTEINQEQYNLQKEQIEQNYSNTQIDETIVQILKEFFVDYLIKFEITLKKQLSKRDKCCCSNTKKVSQHCLTIIESILFNKLKIDQKTKNIQQKEIEKSTKNENKQFLFQQFQIPHLLFPQQKYKHEIIKQNNLLSMSQIYEYKNLPSNNYNTGTRVQIEEEAFNFYDKDTQQIDNFKRKNTIEQFERCIVYEKD